MDNFYNSVNITALRQNVKIIKSMLCKIDSFKLKPANYNFYMKKNRIA